MIKYFELIRIKHWVKNFLIFVPILFAKAINFSNTVNVIIAFFSFSFMASSIYIINDVKDIEKDKLHPRKRYRPLPSGKVKKKNAIIMCILLIVVSFALNYFSCLTFLNYSFLFLLIYMLINVLYSFGLKDFAIIDIFLLASGFIIRVYYGASIINVRVSDYLFLTVLNASLFLGLGKRKKEFINNKKSRKVLNEYNESFLDKFQYLCLSLCIVFYSMWTLEQNINYLTYLIPIFLMIFMRYSLVIEKINEGDPTTILFNDRPLFLLSIIYGILIILLVVVI